jgi:hypothetical protein
VVLAWSSKAEAFESGVMANAIRTDLSDADVLNVFAGGNVSVARMGEITSKPETTLRKLEKISRYAELHILIRENLMTVGRLASLVETCKDDPVRIAKLIAAMQAAHVEATAVADKAKAEIALRRGQKIDPALRKRADAKKFFDAIDYDGLKLDLVKPNQSEEVKVQRASKTGTTALRVGDDTDWETDVALYGFGLKHSEATPEDLENFLKQLPAIKLKVEAIIARLKRDTTPLPSLNPPAPERAIKETKKQEPNLVPNPE